MNDKGRQAFTFAVDSCESLEYAVLMAAPTQSDTESQVRLWIKKHKKENSRLEFKLKVDLSTSGAKAEFIRDVIALAIPRAKIHAPKHTLLSDLRTENFMTSRMNTMTGLLSARS